MTYDAQEVSNYGGSPVVLYEFRRDGDPAIYWRYTSAEADITVGDATYTAVAISDEGVVQSGEATTDDFTVLMPSDTEIPLMFRGTVPSDPIYLTVRRKHIGSDDTRVVWVGSISSVVQEDETVQTRVTCNTLVASLRRGGLRLTWSRGCPHALFDSECRVDPDDFNSSAEVESMTGNSLTAEAWGLLPDGRLTGGYIQFASASGAVERRAVIRHLGDTLTLMGSTDGIEVGDMVEAFYGCARTRQDCNDTFDNLSNFGGFAHQPGKSPFDGDPVF